MKKIALIAAVAASFAAPAFAQSALQLKVDIGNANADTVLEQVTGPLTLGTTVSSRGDSALSQGIAITNAAAENGSERIRPGQVTLFSGTPGHASDIFERLAQESRDEDS